MALLGICITARTEGWEVWGQAGLSAVLLLSHPVPSGTAVPSSRAFRDKGTGAEPADVSQNSPAWTELGVTRCAGESGEEGVLPRQGEPS